MTRFKNKPFHFLLSLVLVLSTQPIKADTDFADFVKKTNDEEKICVPYERDGGRLKCLSFFVKGDVLHLEKCARNTNSVKSKFYCKSAGEISLDELAVFTERICSVDENKEACATLRNNLTLEYEENNLTTLELWSVGVGVAGVGAWVGALLGAVAGAIGGVMAGAAGGVMAAVLFGVALAGAESVAESVVEAGALVGIVTLGVMAVAGAFAWLFLVMAVSVAWVGAGALAGTLAVALIGSSAVSTAGLTTGCIVGAIIGAIIGGFGGVSVKTAMENQERKKEMIATIQSKLNEKPLKEQDIDSIIAELTRVMQEGLNETSSQSTLLP